jgi:hypothetical protein
MAERKAAKGVRAVIRIRDKVRKENLEFSLNLVKALAIQELAKTDYDQERLEGYVDYCVKVVDDAYTKKHDSSARFLPGMEFDLEGDHKLGEAMRVDKRKCLIRHERIVLENERKNWLETGKEYRRKKKIFDKLEPYWLEGMSKEEAVEAFYRDHPPEGLTHA